MIQILFASMVINSFDICIETTRSLGEDKKVSSLEKSNDEELWVKVRNGDEVSRRVIFERYAHLPYLVASTNFARNLKNHRLWTAIDLDDLVQVGLIRLWKIILEFDTARSKLFEPYAVHKLRFAMQDFLRASHALDRREVRRRMSLSTLIEDFNKRGLAVEDVNESDLRQLAGDLNDPSIKATAKRLKTLLQNGHYRMRIASLDRWDSLGGGRADSDGDVTPLRDLLSERNSEREPFSLNRKLDIDRLLRDLDPLERMIVDLHYVRGVNQVTLAKLVSISTHRLWSILQRIKRKWRKEFKTPEDLMQAED